MDKKKRIQLDEKGFRVGTTAEFLDLTPEEEAYIEIRLDNNGVVWVKSGSDKRRVTSKEELRRLFQSSDLVHADEVPVTGTTENDIDLEYFKEFYQEQYEEAFDKSDLPLIRVLNNLNLARDNKLNIAGLLLFGNEPEKYKPAFIVKAVSFVGNDPAGDCSGLGN